ncbi:MAG: flagellar basal body rod protein FlgB [Rhodospirillaceae bacterium]
MDVGNLKLFQMALTKMDWASQRQKLLSQNVVNANTPDYKPQDLKEVNFRRELRKATPLNVIRTNPNHSKGTLPTRDAFRNREVRRNFEASPDGNKVILEEQMQKVGDTRGDYNMALTLMQSHMKMLKTALGK